MAAGPFERIVRYLHRTAGLPDAGELTDGQLLERFVTGRDAAAFETLVRRHGPLVWNVCRRLLHQEHDAQDAFQATFLVLLRKADALERRPSLGSWLYGVAYRVAWNALKARAIAARHRVSEPQVVDMAQTELRDEPAWQELRAVLDSELERLPEKYRAPLVLCCLEGKTNEQAARELGWPIGSMSRRLARGRDLLRRRLTGRGVALTAVALGMALTENATARVPTGVVSSTLQAAQAMVTTGTTAGAVSAAVASLTEGVLKAMWITKVKIAALVLAATVVLTGSAALLHQALAADPPAAAQAPEKPQPPQSAVDKATLPALPAAFTEVHALVKPRADESQVERIPWKTTLWEARLQAAADGKPIFIWVTGGPPGGC